MRAVRGVRSRSRAAWTAYAVTCAIGVGTAVPGCAATVRASVLDRATEDRELVIGVKYDQPALGLWGPGGVEGFDVDVARYVATRLGGPGVRIRFQEARSADRENLLRSGRVDLVFATYSITPERKRKVFFGGPYYVAHQDTMVRAADRTVRGVNDLANRRLCRAAGSNSWRRVTEERSVRARLVPAGGYRECVQKLKAGRLDAVSTDDLILAGYALQNISAVRLVNVPFTDEKYGVGIRRGDVAGCEAVNRALTEMYQDGTARRLLDRWFGPTRLRVIGSVPQFEGCG